MAMGEGPGSGVMHIYAGSLALLFMRVTLGKSLPLSMPQFSHLSSGGTNSSCFRSLLREDLME